MDSAPHVVDVCCITCRLDEQGKAGMSIGADLGSNYGQFRERLYQCITENLLNIMHGWR